MFEIGRVCVKIAGRDSGKKCVVVNVIDDNYVLIDGETRRKKVNVKHLEPLSQIVDISKDADKEAIKSVLNKWDIKKTNPKKKTEKLKKQRKALNKKK